MCARRLSKLHGGRLPDGQSVGRLPDDRKKDEKEQQTRLRFPLDRRHLHELSVHASYSLMVVSCRRAALLLRREDRAAAGRRGVPLLRGWTDTPSQLRSRANFMFKGILDCSIQCNLGDMVCESNSYMK
ncbi:hypothetical protein F2P81_004563 [Scophthalmus maximus]|uniref:Uncharacterized protein n=1 Tax=Scophthalmus maximus TaxID=52904 RepID=A0A6A4T6K9_SCOMX|nr:hypothetical protein F2P81_004563 [Scophthalmus maximus]